MKIKGTGLIDYFKELEKALEEYGDYPIVAFINFATPEEENLRNRVELPIVDFFIDEYDNECCIQVRGWSKEDDLPLRPWENTLTVGQFFKKFSKFNPDLIMLYPVLTEVNRLDEEFYSGFDSPIKAIDYTVIEERKYISLSISDH